MPTVFSNGDISRPLFIVKCSKVKFRTVDKDNRWDTETIFDCLPCGSLVVTRKDVAGVDSKNFASWASHFAEKKMEKTRGWLKILLLYDRYRSHLGLKDLHILKKTNFVACCLHAHTSGVTQPLNVGIYTSLNVSISDEIRQETAFYEDPTLDQLDPLKLVTTAYHRAFTR